MLECERTLQYLPEPLHSGNAHVVVGISLGPLLMRCLHAYWGYTCQCCFAAQYWALLQLWTDLQLHHRCELSKQTTGLLELCCVSGMANGCSIGTARVQATQTFDELLLLNCAAV